MGKKKTGRPNNRSGVKWDRMKRSYVVISWIKGESIKSLTKELKCDRKTIKKILKKYEKTGDVEDEQRPGRPRCTTEREDRLLCRRIETDNSLSAKALALKEAPIFTKNRISITTVQRRIKETGKNGRVRRKKPLLRAANKVARLEWAKTHADWTLEDWHKVIFSDESPFHLFQEGGRLYCWRRPGEEFLEKNLKPTVKHGGGSIQVWGCFCYSGKGPLHRIAGIMNGEKYKQILIKHMSPFFKEIKQETGDSPIFQHDNDPKHKSKKVQTYLENKKYQVLDWPSQSPDLNPIEHVWRQVKMAIYARFDKATSLDEVFNIVQEEWDNLPMANLHKLVDSMPARIQAVIKAKGGHTKY